MLVRKKNQKKLPSKGEKREVQSHIPCARQPFRNKPSYQFPKFLLVTNKNEMGAILKILNVCSGYLLVKGSIAHSFIQQKCNLNSNAT